MAYKLKSQDLKDITAGTTAAAIRAGGEERRAQRAEMKEIRQGLRDTKKSIKQIDKSINWDDPSVKKVDALDALSSRREGLLKKKADIKDWSTRKRVIKGGKEGVNLHGNIEAHTKSGEALYKSGSFYGDTKVDIGNIRADQEADTEMNTGGQQYTNRYTIGGDYKYSYPTPTDVDKPSPPKIPFPEKPPITNDWGAKPQKQKVDVPGRSMRVSNKMPKSKYSRSHKGKLFERRYVKPQRGLKVQDTRRAARKENRELAKEYREGVRDWRQSKRESKRSQKADFRQQRRDWWRSQFV